MLDNSNAIAALEEHIKVLGVRRKAKLAVASRYREYSMRLEEEIVKINREIADITRSVEALRVSF